MNEQDREALAKRMYLDAKSALDGVVYEQWWDVLNEKSRERYRAKVKSLEPLIEQIAERRAAEVWDEGYNARRLEDAHGPGESNPYRAALDGGEDRE